MVARVKQINNLVCQEWQVKRPHQNSAVKPLEQTFINFRMGDYELKNRKPNLWCSARSQHANWYIMESHCCLQVQPSLCLCSVKSSLWHCSPSPSSQPSREGMEGKNGSSSSMGSTHMPPHQGVQAQQMNWHICLPEFVLMLTHCKDF